MLLYILPAYIANAIPVLIGKLTNYAMPIDCGRFLYGERIFGQGKTWPGFISGLLAGTITGILLGIPLLGFLLSIGALLGDLIASFAKRRAHFPRGAQLPIIDQLDFLFGALIFSAPLYPFTNVEIIILILITPPIHLGANIIAYFLKLKKEWW